MIQQSFYVFTRLASDKGDGSIGHLRKILAQIANPAIRRHLIFQLIPLVDHKHTRLVVLFDVLRKLFINLRDSLSAIQEMQHNIGPPNTPLGTMGPIEIDIGSDTFLST